MEKRLALFGAFVSVMMVFAAAAGLAQTQPIDEVRCLLPEGCGPVVVDEAGCKTPDGCIPTSSSGCSPRGATRTATACRTCEPETPCRVGEPATCSTATPTNI